MAIDENTYHLTQGDVRCKDLRQHWHNGKQTKTRCLAAQTAKKITKKMEKKNEIDALLGICGLGSDLHGNSGTCITSLCATIHRGVYCQHLQGSQ